MELPESAKPRCVACGEPIEHVELFEVTGFERERRQGGANQIIARRRTGRVVGSCCARKVQAGTAEQGVLL
jgi:hypothetical protein